MMHPNNHKWLRDLTRAYPTSFRDCRVLEIGSKFWEPPPNHSVRPYFENCVYVGVDREPGDGVDLVCEADATSFDEPFDTLVMFSVFEHDPDWRKTLVHNLQWLKPGGLFLTCFGAEGNLPHLMRWCPVPYREFLTFTTEVGLGVLDAFFEEDRYGAGCAGCYNAVAAKLVELETS